MAKYNTFFLITGVILVGLIVGVILLAVQASHTNSANETSLQTLNNKVTSLQTSVASANTAMTSLTDQMNEAITTLTSNTSLNSQEIAEANAGIN